MIQVHHHQIPIPCVVYSQPSHAQRKKPRRIAKSPLNYSQSKALGSSTPVCESVQNSSLVTGAPGASCPQLGHSTTENESLPTHQLQALPIQLAIIETLESMIMTCHENVLYINNPPELHVKIRTIGEEETEQLCFQVKVLGTCSNPQHFNIEDFLKCHAVCLVKIIREMERAHHGGHLWTEFPINTKDGMKNLFTEWNLLGQPRIVKQELKASSPCAKIVFRLMQNMPHVLKECKGLENYMHKLKITHPHISINFSLNAQGAKSSSDFGGITEGHHQDRNRPVLNIEHYMNFDDNYDGYDRIQLRTSTSCKISAGLKLTVGVALIPTPSPGDLILNTDCTSVQLLLYGPGRLPVLLPGVQMARPDPWLTMNEYGLKLGPQIEPACAKGVVVPDSRYQLIPTDPKSEEKDDSTQEYIIQIFLFFDPDGVKEDPTEKLCMNDDLRQVLPTIFSKHRTKIKKGVGQTLSKLLQHRLVDQQKQKMMEASIPSICATLTDVVRRCTSDTFRPHALTALQVADTQDLYRSCHKTLWTIASDKYGVQLRETHDNPRYIARNSQQSATGKPRQPKKKRQQQPPDKDSHHKRARVDGTIGESPATNYYGNKTNGECSTATSGMTGSRALSQSQSQGHSQGKDSVMTSQQTLTDSADTLDSQDLDNFDLLGLDLGPIDIDLDPEVVENVLSDLVKPLNLPTSGDHHPCDLDSSALNTPDVPNHDQSFDFFSAEPGAAGFLDDEWLGDLLSTL